MSNEKLTRIGIFYDGNYFLHVSNFYRFNHPRQARISMSGLHHFIRQEVSKAESADPRYCQVVDAHYFRGRLSADEANQRNQLYGDRLFDDSLIREGIVAHHLPLSQGGEKGIDVWLALEAFELAIYKRFDVVVLVAGDGDFLPLVRKLNTLGTRVMLTGWDFKYVDDKSVTHETRMSQFLLDEVTYPVMMHQVIDDRSRKDDQLVNGLFVPQRETAPSTPTPLRPALMRPTLPLRTPATEVSKPEITESAAGGMGDVGTLVQLKDVFGFIKPDAGGSNLYFHSADVTGVNFGGLNIDDRVRYQVGKNDRGFCARNLQLV